MGLVAQNTFKEEIENKETCSSIFFRNLLNYPLSFWSDNYYNTYIELDKSDAEEHKLIIVFIKDFINAEFINSKYEDLTQNKLFEDFSESENFVMFRFKFPSNFKNDFWLVLNGDFSKTSNHFKEINLHCYNRFDKSLYNKYKKIFYPSNNDIEELEKQLEANLPKREIFSKPALINECYDLKMFI
jgi:hypothetical protein